MLETVTKIRAVLELLGHADVKTTEIFAHVMRKGFDGSKSPLNRLYDKSKEKYDTLTMLISVTSAKQSIDILPEHVDPGHGQTRLSK